MNRFSFDTAGKIAIEGPRIPQGFTEPMRSTTFISWSDLSPFAQGYVTAAFEDGAQHEDRRSLARRGWGFHHLAPATLETMLRDCEGMLKWALEICGVDYDNRLDGAWCWQARQRGQFTDLPTAFPPTTLFLSEDGLIHQREQQP